MKEFIAAFILVVIIVVLWMWYPPKLENFLHGPLQLHSWMDGYGASIIGNGIVYEPFDLSPLTEKIKQSGQNFATTLQRRLGMENAGSMTENLKTNSCIGTFDCYYENYNTHNDIGAGTMWSGLHGRSALPN